MVFWVEFDQIRYSQTHLLLSLLLPYITEYSDLVGP